LYAFLDKLKLKPDIIHIHHTDTGVSRLQFFSDTPTIFFCYDRTSVNDVPIIHPQIMQYIAVGQNTRDRLIESDLPIEKIHVLFNWVDTQKFHLK
jgi:hypothetical protein